MNESLISHCLGEIRTLKVRWSRYYNGVRLLRTPISCVAATFFIALAPTPTNAVGLYFPLVSRWSATLDATPAFAPAFDDAHAYIGLTSKQFMAILLESGKTAWSVECPITAPPAAGDALAFVGGDGFVQARAQKDGTRQWETSVEGTVTSLYWDTGWLLATTDKGALLTLRASDGNLLWHRDLGEGLQSAPAPAGDRVYLPTKTGAILALTLATGEEIWRKQLPKPANGILPVDDRLYVAATDDKFYCLSAKKGNELWSWRTGGDVIGLPVLDTRRVYFVSLDNMLRALDRNSGSLRWQKTLPMRPSSGPLLTGWTLIVPGVSAEVHGYSTQFDGTLVGDFVQLTAENRERKLAGPPHLTNDGLVVILRKDGHIEAFVSSPSPSGP